MVYLHQSIVTYVFIGSRTELFDTDMGKSSKKTNSISNSTNTLSILKKPNSPEF
jgi:hypothetical protein